MSASILYSIKETDGADLIKIVYHWTTKIYFISPPYSFNIYLTKSVPFIFRFRGAAPQLFEPGFHL